MRGFFLNLFIAVVAICLNESLFGAEFVPLGYLPGGFSFSDAWAVSADGTTVVGEASTPTGFEAVRWTFPGGIQPLGARIPSFGGGVSADGSVIVSSRAVGADEEAFRWMSGSGVVGLGDLPGGPVTSKAFDVSADGRVIVGVATSDQGPEAFRWMASNGIVGLGVIPGGDYGSYATGASADGSVIVGADRTATGFQVGHEAFRWTAATGMSGLGDLPGGGFYSVASDVSADGSVVVGQGAVGPPSDFRAFRWTSATGMVALPDVPNVGPTQDAAGISGDGNVIVGSAYNDGFGEAYAWDPIHGSRAISGILTDQRVNLTGWRLDAARSASFDGLTIVGLGTNPSGEREAWLARLDPGTFIPEPSSLSLTAILLATLYFFWRCRTLIFTDPH